LIQLADNEEITVPKLDINLFLIAFDKERLRYAVPIDASGKLGT